MGYTHVKKHLAVQGAYFLVNCLTFVARFLIFHYVLFAKKSTPPAPVVREYAAADAAGGGGDTGPMPALVPGGGDPAPEPQPRR